MAVEIKTNWSKHKAVDNVDLNTYNMINAREFWDSDETGNYMSVNDGSDNTVFSAARSGSKMTLTASSGGIHLSTTGKINMNDEVDMGTYDVYNGRYFWDGSGSGNYMTVNDGSDNAILFASRSGAKLTLGASSGGILLSTTGGITLNDTVDMGTYAITNMSDPSNSQDAATKSYVDGQAGDNLGNHTATQDLDMSNHNIDSAGNVYCDDVNCDDVDASGTLYAGGGIDAEGNNLTHVNKIWVDYLDGNTMNFVTMAGDLDMDGYDLNNANDVTINGSLVVSGAIEVHDIYPDQDNYRQCGLSGTRWAQVHTRTLYEGDHVFSERKCPICNKEFKKGEAIVNYVKSNTEEGTRTVPAHLRCVVRS